MSETTRRWLAWIPAAAWAAMIFVLSSQPRLPSLPGVGDKQGHAFTFGTLAVLCLTGLTGARHWRVNRTLVIVAFALTVLYGVSDEVHQSFVPGRTPDVADLLADAVGAAVALGAGWASAILLRRRNLAPRA